MVGAGDGTRRADAARDRKSTRLNSSHSQISYAVFCLKKKKNQHHPFLPHHAIRVLSTYHAPVEHLATIRPLPAHSLPTPPTLPHAHALLRSHLRLPPT